MKKIESHPLYREMLKKDKSVLHFCESNGFAYQTVMNIMLGNRNPSFKMIRRFQKSLELTEKQAQDIIIWHWKKNPLEN